MMKFLGKYEPTEFQITLNETKHELTKDFPEQRVLDLIQDWIYYLDDRLSLGVENNERWKNYPKAYYNSVVMANSVFPIFLPIGFVIASFFLSTSPITYILRKHQDELNEWLQQGDHRKMLFEAHDRNEFYSSVKQKQSVSRPASEPVDEFSAAADILYKPPNQLKLL